MSSDLPYIPFDPSEVGPFELVGIWWARAKNFVAENTIATVAGGVALIAAFLYFKPPIPDPPNWFWVAVLGSLVAVVIVWPVSKKVAAALHNPDYVMVSEQDPITGDQRIKWISPERFQSMTILNHNDREVTKEYLEQVVINGEMAYEVDKYSEEENLAIASWQAGVSNSEMRRERSRIKTIKTDLEEEANKALEVLANNPDIVRQAAADVSNELIRLVEEVENPNGARLHERMTETLDDADVSDDLIGSENDEDGIDSDPADGSESVTIELDASSAGGNGGSADE